MLLLVGLGNPGLRYDLTKHNFGFLLIDKIVEDYQLESKADKFSNKVFEGNIAGKKIIAIKPQKYMNLSGTPVQSISSFYKIPLENIIVFHDDLDISLGSVKTKIGGGSAGHNGLKDIDKSIGKDYIRVRLGIGRPENSNYDISDYVLSRFSKEEILVVEDVNNKISKLMELIVNLELSEFFNKFRS